MPQPSNPSPERATRGDGKNIPIEDTRAAAGETQPPAGTTDSGNGSNPSSGADAAAAPTDPQGSASARAAQVFEDAEAVLDGVVIEPTTDEQVAKAKAEATEWQDKYLRLHAEWDTYRRRTTEQREAEKARATEKLVESLLPVIDDFERTIDYADKNGEGGLLDGVKAVHSKLVATLVKDGVQVIDPKGEAFDALEAQAVATVEDASVPDETVADVYQKGYKMGSKCLRPAMVTVTSGGPKREKPQEDAEK